MVYHFEGTTFSVGATLGMPAGTGPLAKTFITYFSKFGNDVDQHIGRFIDEFAKSGKLKAGNLRTALEKLSDGGARPC